MMSTCHRGTVRGLPLCNNTFRHPHRKVPADRQCVIAKYLGEGGTGEHSDPNGHLVPLVACESSQKHRLSEAVDLAGVSLSSPPPPDWLDHRENLHQ